MIEKNSLLESYGDIVDSFSRQDYFKILAMDDVALDVAVLSGHIKPPR